MQQSMYRQSSVPEAKQAVTPSAFWMARTRFPFLILPASTPIAFALEYDFASLEDDRTICNLASLLKAMFLFVDALRLF